MVYQLVALVFALVCIAVGLLWLRSQLPRLRHNQDNVFANHAGQVEGRNVIAGGALASAIEDDLEHHPAVEQRASSSDRRITLIRVSVSAADALPVGELRATVIEPATARAIRVGELPDDIEVLTDVRLVPEHPSTRLTVARLAG